MQPAPNTEILFSVEESIELVFVGLIQNAGVLNIYPSRSNDSEETPCVEVALITGDALRHGKIHFIGEQKMGAYSPDAWSSQLVFTIKTQRGTNNSSHKQYIGKIRDQIRMIKIAGFWNPDSYYRIAGVSGGASKRFSDDDKNLDITEMTYSMDFGIHPDAWPTG